jgi:elongation factor Ts
MAKIDIKLIQEVRERTGAGMLNCRKALEEADGDIQKAIEILRTKGAASAEKRAGRNTAEGIVQAYIHPGDQIGVLIEIGCETDFVARTDEIINLAKDLCMHIAAFKPMYLSPEEVDQKFLEHERSIFKAQLADSGKPEKIIDQIVEGKINKLYTEVCLLKQAYIKNDQFAVEDILKQLIAKIGENIVIKRFARFEVGA